MGESGARKMNLQPVAIATDFQPAPCLIQTVQRVEKVPLTDQLAELESRRRQQPGEIRHQMAQTSPNETQWTGRPAAKGANSGFSTSWVVYE